jgi:ABC-2 type transport system permease protein
MGHWQTVLRYELQRQLSRKAFWGVTLGIPLLGALLLAALWGYQEIRERTQDQEESNQTEFEGLDPVGYIDETGLFPAPSSESPFAGLVRAYPDLVTGQTALEADEVSALYLIGPDYLETGKVTTLLPSISFAALESNLMEAFLVQSLAGELDPYLALRLRLPIMQLEQQVLAQDGNLAQSENEDTNFLVVYIYALVLMLAVLMSSGYLMQSVVEEKESKVIEIILTSVKPFPLLLGKTLAMGLTGLLQVLVWAFSAYALFSVAAQNVPDLSGLAVEPLTILIALIYFFLGFGVVGGVFAAMGTLIGNVRDGSQLVGWVVLPFISPLFFVSAFATDSDGTLARVMSLVPFSAPLAMLMRVSVGSVPLGEVLLSMSLTFGLMLASIWLAGRVFRVQSLLRGTAPKWRDLRRLIWED